MAFDDEKYSALAYACRRGKLEIINDLVVAIEAKHGKEALLEFARKVSKKKESLLYLSIKSGNVDAVKKVLEFGSKMMNFRDAEGRAILHVAVSSGNLEIIKEIEEYVDGSDWLSEDKRGSTAISFAIKNAPVLEHVLDATRKIASKEEYRTLLNKENEEGETPLILAVKKGALSSFKVSWDAWSLLHFTKRNVQKPLIGSHRRRCIRFPRGRR